MIKMDRKSMLIRIPLDIKDWIQAEAKDSFSSQNSFVVRSLRKAMQHASTESDAARSALGNGTLDQVE